MSTIALCIIAGGVLGAIHPRAFFAGAVFLGLGMLAGAVLFHE